MDIADTRHRHLAELASKYENQRLFALACGLVAPHVSQMLNKKRGVGEGVARRIEQKLGLPFGYMDTPSGSTPAPATAGADRHRQRTLMAVSEETEDALIVDLQARIAALRLDKDKLVPSVRVMGPLGVLMLDATVLGRDIEYGIDFIGAVPNLGHSYMLERLAGQALRCQSFGRRFAYCPIVATPGDIDARLIETLVYMQEKGLIFMYAILSDEESYSRLLRKIFEW